MKEYAYLKNDTDDPAFSNLFEDIENDLYYDINNLLNKPNSLYKKDKFKHKKNAIDIIYPRHYFPKFKSEFKDPDSVRFLLSIYPVKENLGKIQKIILRPRHIEIDETELVSLYIRKEKILVLYLHYPYMYKVGVSMLPVFSGERMSEICGTAGKFFKVFYDSGKPNILEIPPLWYILTIISAPADNEIEKFFVKRDPQSCMNTLRKIYDISSRYSRMGY